MELTVIHINLRNFKGAITTVDRAAAIYERLVEREGRREVLGDLALTKGLRSKVLFLLNRDQPPGPRPMPLCSCYVRSGNGPVAPPSSGPSSW